MTKKKLAWLESMLLVAGLAVLVAPPAAARTICVSKTNPNCANKIQTAIQLALFGDTVRIQVGP